MTDFDRNYLDQPDWVRRRQNRDDALRALKVDPEDFKRRARQDEVDNECGTDEYRETQPSKGLHYISEFTADWAPGVQAMNEMMGLVKKWIDAGANMDQVYSGADELVPILNMCFDFMWEQGGFSLYSPYRLPEEEDIEAFQEMREGWNE